MKLYKYEIHDDQEDPSPPVVIDWFAVDLTAAKQLATEIATDLAHIGEGHASWAGHTAIQHMKAPYLKRWRRFGTERWRAF
jgi:hypothetical protein